MHYAYKSSTRIVDSANVTPVMTHNVIKYLKLNISKTKRDTGLVSIDHLYAASNGHMTDDVRGPCDVILRTP